MTATTTPLVGQTGVYIDSKGHEKAVLVVATPETFLVDEIREAHPDAEVEAIPEGHALVALFGLTGIQYRVLPGRAQIEDIPDYTVEGQLRGFFEVR